MVQFVYGYGINPLRLIFILNLHSCYKAQQLFHTVLDRRATSKLHSMANLPYNPTAAFLSNRHQSDIVYILQPINGTSPFFQLSALNVNDTLNTANISPTIISPALPFSNNHSTSFTSSSTENGTILVYAGDCKDKNGAMLWMFTATEDGTNGTWTGKEVTGSFADGPESDMASKYLSAAMVFSPGVNTTSDVYIFGGTCPNSTTLFNSEWQTSANYSNIMLLLESSLATSSAFQQVDLEARIVPGRGPPISEAGFSATALEPSFLNTSDGNTSKQQNFVLLGGHTREAFINMSQVALYSLPEQSWAFLPVQPPPPSAKADLAARGNNGVDPRSGHTAILTSDGEHIVVFGGWVGDVATPASPQLAILDLGEGFGGLGEWQWTVPKQSGEDPLNGSGLYGHGAVMLPGEIMMIVGGRSISNSEVTTSESPDSLQSTNYYFFDITSNSWLSSYTNPNVVSDRGDSSSSNAGAHRLSPASKAGIGAGLGVISAAIIGLLMVYFCCIRKRRTRRHVREKNLRDLSIRAQRSHSPVLDLAENDRIAGGENPVGEGMAEQHSNAYPWAPRPFTALDSEERFGWKEVNSSDAERTGLLVEIPSPTRGLRRSLHSRSTYQQPSWYEEGRLSRGSGHIHPIDERDEYAEDFDQKIPSDGLEKARPPNVEILSAAPPVLDPFSDPALLGSHPIVVSRTPSPQSPARERELEIQNWVSDWTAADALMHNHTGHVSPDKTDRTSSTLSERSNRSSISAHSVGGLGRSLSQRSTNLFSVKPLLLNNKTEVGSSIADSAGSRMSTKDLPNNTRRSHSLTLENTPFRGRNSDLFATKETSFSQLQAEGEALLGKRDEPYERLPFRSHSRAKAWMGSMRRAFAPGDHTISTSLKSGDRSASSSPTKSQYTETGIPRRAASTGTMLWRRKQGAKDWDAEGFHNGSENQRGASWTGADEEEWDVESAVERRVVQVMFTVPKERLRVVNGAPEGDGESIVSLETWKGGKHAEPNPDGAGHDHRS